MRRFRDDNGDWEIDQQIMREESRRAAALLPPAPAPLASPEPPTPPTPDIMLRVILVCGCGRRGVFCGCGYGNHIEHQPI